MKKLENIFYFVIVMLSCLIIQMFPWLVVIRFNFGEILNIGVATIFVLFILTLMVLSGLTAYFVLKKSLNCIVIVFGAMSCLQILCYVIYSNT
jgi:hypothetical protein